MIQINMLTSTQAALVAEVAKFHRLQYNRSFSERHPEEGKMMNCPFCDLRHRVTKNAEKYATNCFQQFAVNPRTKEVMTTPNTRKGVNGAAAFARKRFHPHRNAFTLLVLQRAGDLYAAACDAASAGGDRHQVDYGKCIRRAFQSVRDQREAERRLKRLQQSIARSINFGLIRPGTRPIL